MNILRHLRDPVRAPGVAIKFIREVLRKIKGKRRRQRFAERRQSLVAGMHRKEVPEGIVVFLDCNFWRDGGMYAVIAHRLIGMGWAPVDLLGKFRPAPHPNPDINSLEGGMARYSRLLYRLAEDSIEAPLAHSWEINPEQGICRAEGINFFPVVLGKLRRYYKRYTLDWSNEEVLDVLNQVITSADAALSLCKKLEELSSRGLPVRVLGAEHLYVPSGIFMMYCAERRGKGVEFIDFSGAYAHFFTAGDYIDRHYYAAQNITRRDVISRHVVLREEFDDWVSHCQNNANIVEGERNAIKRNWTGKDGIDPDTLELIELMLAHRSAGGKVACLFGHVGFDLGVPRDHGDAHLDMVDWLNDTIKSVADKNIMLLIKPHPTEKRFKPNRAPSQLLADLITEPLSDNVILLDALQINTHELNPFLDIGLVWRSNAALELTLIGKPVIVAGREAAYRQSLDLPSPTSREQYHDMLANIDCLKPSQALQERCALFLSYLKQQNFIHLPFIRNQGIKVAADGFRYINPALEWDEEELSCYLLNGNAQVDRVCRVIVK